jgi:hypothetical protein
VVAEGGVEGVEVEQVLELSQVAVEEHRRHVLEVDAERQARVVEVVEDGTLRVALGQQPASLLIISHGYELSLTNSASSVQLTHPPLCKKQSDTSKHWADSAGAMGR